MVLLLPGCGLTGAGYRSLHEVDGQVVQSPPPPPSAYDAYLRARLAMEQEPPQLDAARYHIGRALAVDPRDPHLWSTRAEIEERAGQREAAVEAARRALVLRPGYPLAEEVLARLQGESGRAGEAQAAGDRAPEPVATMGGKGEGRR